MLRVTLAILGACLLAGGTLSQASQFPSAAVILPLSEAPNVLTQCSRPTVSSVDEFWLPSESEIVRLESALAVFLSASAQRTPSAPLSEFNRQYVGVVSGGRKLIYGSFFHRSAGTVSGDDTWRTKAVIVCDGGDWFWGITFDPEAQTFDEPNFNGEA